jgi:excisionase family DNA binding protein
MTVTVEEAAKIVGVSARTVRRWINRGWLPWYDGANGKLVSPADLASAQAAARRGHGHDRDHVDTTDTNTDTQANTRAATAIDQAQRQLEVLRDTLLVPLIAQNDRLMQQVGELERENGRLEADREAVIRERDELRSRLEALKAMQSVPEPVQESSAPVYAYRIPEASDTRPWWRKLMGI